MELAIDFGIRNNSCSDAMEWRRSLPEGTTQTEAYLLCKRGDWALWQLECLPKTQFAKLKPAIDRIVVRIASRTIRCELKSLRGIKSEEATNQRRWSRRWLSGEDRSYKSADAARTVASAVANAAASAAAWDVAWDAASAAASAAARAATWDVVSTTARTTAWDAASATASAAAWDIAWDTENKLQLRDIRSEIPAWPRK